MAHFNLH